MRKIVGDQETAFVYDAAGALVAEYTTNQPITNEGTKYLTADTLGSPRAISDIGGTVTSRHDYMPFGEEVFAGVGGRTSAQGYLVNNDGIRKQFTGYERDDESGLDYAQARYFNPRHGRFTSVDPMTASAEVKNPQTLNRYSYGLNSPYKFVDPLGLRGSDLTCFGNTSGGGANSIGSCEAQRSLDFYEERLQNTMDEIAANRSKAKRDKSREEAAVTILPPGPNDDLSLSTDGKNLLIELEGNEPVPYSNDSNSSKNCTVGIGHLLHKGKCTSSEADTRTYSASEIQTFLRKDVAGAEAIVKAGINVKLTQKQFDALVVFAMNIPSAPRMYNAINRRDNDNTKKEWLSANKIWNPKTKKYEFPQGLQNRRNAEFKVFQAGTLLWGEFGPL